MKTIYTFTPNPALDITYTLKNIELGEVHRVEDVALRPGGKGINTSGVLAQMGIANTAVGFFSSEQMLKGLKDRKESTNGLANFLNLPFPWDNRISICLVSDVNTSVFNQASPFYPDNLSSDIQAKHWEEIWQHAIRIDWCDAGSVVSVNGSFPPGTSNQVVQDLLTGLKSKGCRVIVDTSGEFLLLAAKAQVDVLKPNRQELIEATNQNNIFMAVQNLQQLGAKHVVVSDGENGLIWFSPAYCEDSEKASDKASKLDPISTEKQSPKKILRFSPPKKIHGNPTGAGDALVAAICYGISQNEDSILTSADLHRAVAWSAAAVAQPVAGEVNQILLQDLLPKVREEIIHDTM